MKYMLAVIIVFFSYLCAFSQPFTVFSENMGTGAPSSTPYPGVSTYNGFQNYGTVSFNGLADVRNTVVSTGSGDNNVFLTNSGTASFKMSNINIDGATAMNLKFLVHKNTNAENGTSLKINISIDGQTPVPVSFSPLNTGTGTTGWYPISIDLTAYSGSLLSIDFSNSSTANSNYFRLDDVQLISGTKLPVVFGNIKGHIQNQQLYIQWETIQDAHTKLFEIQISENGSDFKTIKTIESKASLGNSNESVIYTTSIGLQQALNMLGIIGISIIGIGIKRKNKFLKIGLIITSLFIFISCNKTFEDSSFQNIKRFARLVQVDQFGKRVYSKTIVIDAFNN